MIIFIATDASLEADCALEYVTDYIAQARDEIYLAHVRPHFVNVPFLTFNSSFEVYRNAMLTNKMDSQQLLISRCKALQQRFPLVKGMSLLGRVHEVLVKEIQEIKPDLVVVGHKQQAWKVNSVVDYLMRRIHVPLLIVNE